MYNDSQLANDKECLNLRHDYEKVSTDATQDLMEIYQQMVGHLGYLKENNSNHEYDRIIDTTTRHISLLSEVLDKSSKLSIYSQFVPQKKVVKSTTEGNPPYPYFRPGISMGSEAITDSWEMGRVPPSTTLIDEGNTGNNGFNNIPNSDMANSLPNTNNNVPNTNNNPSQSTPNNRNSHTRNSPLQSSILSTIAKTIFSRRVKGSSVIQEDMHRNRFHNTYPTTPACQPSRKVVTHELNILRLLILYLCMHPLNRHSKLISTISHERLEILIDIL